VKTRLAASLGEKRALSIYNRLLKHTADITQFLPVDKVVFYSDFIDNNDLWNPEIYQKQLQAPGDLGQRINAAFKWGFDSGYREIGIIGSDCYELTESIIKQGFDNLTQYDAVLGPSRDGGYYFLGIKQMYPSLFQHKKWGTESVSTDTVNDFKKLALHYSLLPPLNDIDVVEDLPDEF